MQTELPELKYNADGLIPCIVQDVETRRRSLSFVMIVTPIRF